MDAHAREAAAAQSAMAEFYGTVWRPSPGDVVRCERPYLGDTAEGVVIATNGTFCDVRLGQETLCYYPHELEFTGRREVVA